jgi:streptomycin 6-kinase
VGAHNDAVASVIVPDRLARNAGRPESPARDWFDALPSTVAAVSKRWGLRLGPPFQPGGVGSWVAPGTDAVGRDVVLKLRWRYPEAAAEASVLAAWDGGGAVRLFDALSDDPAVPPESDALLLERARPGVPLAAMATQPEQDGVVAGLIRRLRDAAPPPGTPLLATMCDQWAAETQREYEALWSAGAATVMSRSEVADGLALLRSLAGDAADSVLLCTDLHAENIVAAHREPWLVIDPHPHVGDPTYDVLQHLLNCRDRLVAEPHWLIDRLARLIDVDPARARRWLYARSVQESLEFPWLVAVAQAMRPA